MRREADPVIRQVGSLAELEGRASSQPWSPMYPMFRAAVEVVMAYELRKERRSRKRKRR